MVFTQFRQRFKPILLDNHLCWCNWWCKQYVLPGYTIKYFKTNAMILWLHHLISAFVITSGLLVCKFTGYSKCFCHRCHCKLCWNLLPNCYSTFRSISHFEVYSVYWPVNIIYGRIIKKQWLHLCVSNRHSFTNFIKMQYYFISLYIF